MKANCLSVVFPVAGLLVFSGLLQAEKNVAPEPGR